LLAAKKMAIIVSFRWESSVLTAARNAGAAAVCKATLKEFKLYSILPLNFMLLLFNKHYKDSESLFCL